jgi:hypothetical protein
MLMTVSCGGVVVAASAPKGLVTKRRGRAREGTPGYPGFPCRGNSGVLHCCCWCRSSKDLLPLPLAAVREGVDRRLRQAGADAGDLKPGSGIGSVSLWRRERVFIGGAEVLCKLHGRDPVTCSRVCRGEWRGAAGLGVCSSRGLEVGSAAGGAGRSSLGGGWRWRVCGVGGGSLKISI